MKISTKKETVFIELPWKELQLLIQVINNFERVPIYNDEVIQNFRDQFAILIDNAESEIDSYVREEKPFE